MKKLSILMAIVLLSLFTAAGFANACSIGFANADSITFDFRGPLEAGSTLRFTVDDFTVTASGISGTTAGFVNRSIFGLGVSSWIFDNPQIDGCGPNDLLILTFSESIILKSAVFSLVGRNDDFQLLNNESLLLTADIPHGGFFDFTPFLDVSERTGSVFGFTVPGFNDDYMLTSIEVAHVPVPPAIILLSTGLMGLIGIRRRFKG